MFNLARFELMGPVPEVQAVERGLETKISGAIKYREEYIEY